MRLIMEGGFVLTATELTSRKYFEENLSSAFLQLLQMLSTLTEISERHELF